jgi:hypothetical protein
MKRTALEKVEAMKTLDEMKRKAIPERYGAKAGEPADKREQREKDKAAGLVPFAVKLPQDLVASLQALARQREETLNDVTAELLRKGMKAKK